MPTLCKRPGVVALGCAGALALLSLACGDRDGDAGPAWLSGTSDGGPTSADSGAGATQDGGDIGDAEAEAGAAGSGARVMARVRFLNDGFEYDTPNPAVDTVDLYLAGDTEPLFTAVGPGQAPPARAISLPAQDLVFEVRIAGSSARTPPRFVARSVGQVAADASLVVVKSGGVLVAVAEDFRPAASGSVRMRFVSSVPWVASGATETRVYSSDGRYLTVVPFLGASEPEGVPLPASRSPEDEQYIRWGSFEGGSPTSFTLPGGMLASGRRLLATYRRGQLSVLPGEGPPVVIPALLSEKEPLISVVNAAPNLPRLGFRLRTPAGRVILNNVLRLGDEKRSAGRGEYRVPADKALTLEAVVPPEVGPPTDAAPAIGSLTLPPLKMGDESVVVVIAKKGAVGTPNGSVEFRPIAFPPRPQCRADGQLAEVLLLNASPSSPTITAGVLDSLQVFTDLAGPISYGEATTWTVPARAGKFAARMGDGPDAKTVALPAANPLGSCRRVHVVVDRGTAPALVFVTATTSFVSQ